eukprot:COSAG04_NODE_27843_length_279_cov_0.866667_1_plen_42_part_10
MAELLQLVPLFDQTKQYLRHVEETRDASVPVLEASGLSQQGG